MKLLPIAETEETVTLSRHDYEALLELLEDLQDVSKIESAKRDLEAGKTDLVDAIVIDRLRAGDNPIQVWREFRRLTLGQLARQAAISPAYLERLETGKETASPKALLRIATALHVETEDLAQRKADVPL